jgi:D-alanyl-lipoteichoic acid acyltransferase DltB (MBOAT superfamily)
MTLSRFLRDFLYVPLGGNRGGRLRTARNLMITMVLGGLWHGAAWGFVLWGALHGVCLVAEHVMRRRDVKAPPAWLRWALVFHLVVLGWILFRAESLDLAGTFIAQLAEPGAATLWTPATLAAVLVVIGFQLLPPDPIERLRERLTALPAPALGTALALVVALVGATVPSQGVPPFIYFQF